MMKNDCALCLKKRDLQCSHIIPKFVRVWLKDSQVGHLRIGHSPNARIQDAYKIPLLCKKCESELSKWETPFSKNIFLPFHKDILAHPTLPYGPWAMKCLVSISWRVALFAKQHLSLRHYTSDQRDELDKAINRWRMFLLDEKAPLSPYVQHLLPFSLIQDHSIPNLSPFINRYIVGSLDLDIVCSEGRALTFAKLGRLVLFGIILDQHPEDWRGTILSTGAGVFGPQNISVPAEVIHYINEKANRSGQAISSMSQRQKDLIEASLLQDLGRFVRTDMAKAMATDIHFSGSKAFDITGSDHRQEEREEE